MTRSHSFREHHLFQLLKQFDQQKLPIDLFVHQYFKTHHALGSKDRRFLAETLFSLIKWKGFLDHFSHDFPTWEKRYATFLQRKENSPSYPPHVNVSCPKELFDLLVEQYEQEKAEKVCLECNNEAPITIRINPLKTSRDELLNKFKDLFGANSCQESPLGITFPKRLPFSEMDEFKSGLFEVQDEGSQLVSLLVNAQPKDRVLDFCAGSGGKTLGFAHLMQNKGEIILHDIRNATLDRARKRLSRAGIFNVRFIDDASKIGKKMDWILLDVPCSGTGTLRRNPDLKWKFSLTMLERIVVEQREIFAKAFPLLGKKGKIVYATCSILKAENEEQIAFFQKEFGLKVTKTFQSLPTPQGMDGFFATVLQAD